MVDSKDFEITDDGELTRYCGAGGEVVIPEGVRFVAREGVFDPSLEITKLHLPASFIGHKCEKLSNLSYVAYGSARKSGDKVRKQGVWAQKTSEIESLSLGPKDALFEPFALVLPKLECFEVDKANLYYSAINGLLLLGRTVIAVPKCYHLPLALKQPHEKFTFYTANQRCYKEAALVITSDSKSLDRDSLGSSLSLSLFKKTIDNLIVIFAPKAVRVELSNDIWGEFVFKRAALIAPMLSTSHCTGAVETLMMRGFCYRPDLYEIEQVVAYEYIMLEYESYMYHTAQKLKLYSVTNFYKRLWAAPLEIEMFTGPTPIAELAEAVLRGTVDDVKSVLQDYSSFITHVTHYDDFDVSEEELFSWDESYEDDEAMEQQDQIVSVAELAFRYRGFEIFNTLIHSKKLTKKESWYEDSFESAMTSRLRNWNLVTNKRGKKEWYLEHLYVDKDGEVRGYEPIDAKERLKCYIAWYYAKPGAFSNLEYERFLAYLLGLDDYARELGEQGVNIANLAKKYEREPNFDKAIKDTLASYPQRLIALAKACDKDGCKFRFLNHHKIHTLIDQPEIVRKLFGHVTLAPSKYKDFMEVAIYRDRLDTLVAVFESGFDHEKVPMSEIIFMANKAGKPEMVAVLLELQNKLRVSGHVEQTLTL